jgi:hypothetical protein
MGSILLIGLAYEYSTHRYIPIWQNTYCLVAIAMLVVLVLAPVVESIIRNHIAAHVYLQKAFLNDTYNNHYTSSFREGVSDDMFRQIQKGVELAGGLVRS